MRNLRLLGVFIATFGLTACLNSTTLVKLKTDGSGTIEQTTLMNTAALKGLGGSQAQANAGPLTNRADLERAAERMGKGVKLVSTEPAKGAPGWEGTKAIFSFDDVNQIQINTEPNMGASDSPLGAAPKDDPVKFKFTRNGATSTLSIDFIDKPGAGAKPSTAQPPEMPDITNPMIMGMLKTMFQGLKITVDLEVVGTIVKTNAAYLTGPRMTLLEVDMGELLADEANLKALQGKIGPDASFSEMKPYLKDIKGIKIDGPSIRVEFR